MKIHKQYECDHCGYEFDDKEECLIHETDCEYNPKLKLCGSCTHGTPTTSYEVEYIRCKRVRHKNETCGYWRNE